MPHCRRFTPLAIALLGACQPGPELREQTQHPEAALLGDAGRTAFGTCDDGGAALGLDAGQAPSDADAPPEDASIALDAEPLDAGALGPGSPRDPGLFSGLWLPPGTVAVYVVDQSEPGGASSTTSIPGCINQRSQLGSNYCGSSVAERIGTLTMAQGNTFAIRYRSEASVPVGQYFKISGGDGAGIPASLELSLSLTYADFNSTPASCRARGLPGQQPFIVLGGVNCAVAPDTRYYLNIRVTSPCSGATCRFKVLEPAALTN